MSLCSGYEFMKLADICIDRINISSDIKQNLKYLMYIEHYDKNDINILKTANIIYFPTKDIDIIFNKFYQYFNNNITIITHNSDYHISDRTDENLILINCMSYLNLPKIKKWYAQNTLIKHAKLYTIPIGIANIQYKHGNQKLLCDIKNKNFDKDNLIYINFDLGNGKKYNIRNSIYNILFKNNYKKDTYGLNQIDYLEKLAKSKYVISPPGNGIDCHRIWECIFLGTIPIVQRNICFEQYKNIPILFVNDWNEINDDLLYKSYDKLYNLFNNIDIVYIDYWKNHIRLI